MRSCCTASQQTPYRYPNIGFIVPHLGGPIPMLNRLDQRGRRDHPNLAETPSVTAKTFRYDAVCYGSEAAFCCALDAFGKDRLVSGPKSVTDKVLRHNAQKLFSFDH